MITLRNRLEDYLKVRRALGWQLVQPAADLRQFVSFLEQEGASTITRGMALRWAKDRVNVNPAFWARRLSFVRLFAKYVHGFDPRTEVPPFGLLPHRYRRHRPYIYTDVEILRLMQAVERIRWRTPRMGRWTYPTLFGLWACTGLRSTEAYKLNRDDVDLDRGILTIRETKFRKSRLVPLHKTTVRALREYARHRDESFPRALTPSFFVSAEGRRLNKRTVQWQFRELCHRAGMRQLTEKHGPRIHDFRHTFVVRTILTWYQAGVDVEARMPALSTYVGHSCVSNTYWYLSSTPELLALASERIERTLGSLP